MVYIPHALGCRHLGMECLYLTDIADENYGSRTNSPILKPIETETKKYSELNAIE